MKKFLCLISLFLLGVTLYASPITGLLERIDKGASRKFVIERLKGEKDFFELDQKGNKVVVRGNNYVSIATGINWYLKYYAGINLSWNGMQADLPEVLPPVLKKERHETDLKLRYDFNYCTFSYSMAFWDWKRWEQEIDWMALHGINLPLAMVGTDVVWKNVLEELGYTREEINAFIAGPGFQAWWLMNNLEGWGGPNPDSWYERQEELQKRILKRMREYGIEPVLPGYSGMVPHNAKDRLGLNVADPGRWNGYPRPAFLQPTDPQFERIAALYYQEMTRLYGKASYYSMDPFHEGGNTSGVDLEAAGKAIWKAMKQANPRAAWVVQAWGANPRPQMIRDLPAGDMVVLDLFSESRPQWGDPASSWYRKEGFGQHDWLFCMLLNYGGNVGLHGKMAHLIEEFYKAKDSSFGKTLKGVGMTMEGIENNPVMYELLCELPWREQRFSKDEWLEGYLKARYGKSDSQVSQAWMLLSNTIYNCPAASTQQGTHESILCARPSWKAYQVSSWSEMSDYYDPADVIRAAGMMVEAAERFRGNNNFEYDLVDIVRQAVAEKGRLMYRVLVDAYKAGDRELFKLSSDRFLRLILMQDRLLATRPEFKVGRWLESARNLGSTEEEKDWYEWNARVQITTWGNRVAADDGGLHDYAHREWNGLLRDFYYLRWKTWLDEQLKSFEGGQPKAIDFYALEEPWTLKHNSYASEAEGNPVDIACEIYREIKLP
ncbi:alpha-N-acetylglucosaminidase [Phocaeicola coprophilus]|uniref:alpha-N-acetylglucosaminidase n=1 Tax=Phocaeicola coprophilus TaxID=387090 RepID=UPI001DD87AF9|nr:alpha-N-acetylglucosaminidase [Phocaeicola coprophilus]HJE47087.1 alpha-N-acetylglucosaminidase [Phocaeicola coprophilus]